MTMCISDQMRYNLPSEYGVKLGTGSWGSQVFSMPTTSNTRPGCTTLTIRVSCQWF
ncbi:hypothetical protein GBAR_LOCUS545 [Geodia barretti]|uniref:Uncharacterized protein n=1 Tax=Geodia barretti TaxID=519541 RepID=A0AA35QTI3_GEOBA|nr:hypothetical protein GBAR_LOCUS545 [Geodia barretti]